MIINHVRLTLPDLFRGVNSSHKFSKLGASSALSSVEGGSTTGGGGAADIAGTVSADDEACLSVAGTILNDPLPATLPTGLYTNSLDFAT